MLNLSNVIIHSFGSYLLISAHRRSGKRNAEKLYILNLSVNAAISNVLVILIDLPPRFTSDLKSTKHAYDIQKILVIIKSTGMVLVYILCITYITIDRLVYIVLNIKYSLYWNPNRAKKLLIGTWLLGLVFVVCIVIAFKTNDFEFQYLFNIYFYPPIEFLFLVLAIVTYCFIFYKYRRARQPPVDSINRNHRQSFWNVFRSSRFFIAVLIIASFVIFVIVPDIYLFLSALVQQEKVQQLVACRIFFALSDMFDAFIYIYFQKEVRKIMFEKLDFIPCIKKHRLRQRQSSVRSHTFRLDVDTVIRDSFRDNLATREINGGVKNEAFEPNK